MRSLRNQIILLFIALTAAHTCPGAFHLWEISQIFSNEDGSVQYIEMYNASNSEQFLNGQDIEVHRDGGDTHALRQEPSVSWITRIPTALKTGGSSVWQY